MLLRMYWMIQIFVIISRKDAGKLLWLQGTSMPRFFRCWRKKWK